jgi:hypothetical protein
MDTNALKALDLSIGGCFEAHDAHGAEKLIQALDDEALALYWSHISTKSYHGEALIFIWARFQYRFQSPLQITVPPETELGLSILPCMSLLPL